MDPQGCRSLSWWGRNATSEAMLHPLALSLMSCQMSRAEQGLPYADRDLFIGSIKGPRAPTKRPMEARDSLSGKLRALGLMHEPR